MPPSATSTPQRRATGPRTPEGRKRAAQNARRHGLTARIPNQADIAAQVHAWTEGAEDDILLSAALMQLAQARSQVERVRKHQAKLLEQLCGFDSVDTARMYPTDQPVQAARDTLVRQYQLSLRYRAEAEAGARKALRAIADHMTANHESGGKKDGA